MKQTKLSTKILYCAHNAQTIQNNRESKIPKKDEKTLIKRENIREKNIHTSRGPLRQHNHRKDLLMLQHVFSVHVFWSQH